MSVLGNFIRVQREKIGISQSTLGRMLHCQKQTISGWETGRRNVNDSYYSMIAKALNVEYMTIKSMGDIDAMKSNDYMKQFLDISSVDDAVNFMDCMMEDFETDEANKVSLKFLLRNYCLMVLLYVNANKNKWIDEDNPYNIDFYLEELSENTLDSLKRYREKYGSMSYTRFECGGDYRPSEVTEFEYEGGLLIDNLKYLLPDDTLQLQIHLFEFISHVRKKCYGEINQADRYMLDQDIDEFRQLQAEDAEKIRKSKENEQLPH